MIQRLIRHFLVFAGAALISTAPVHAQGAYDDLIRERASAHGVSGNTLVRVSWCESRGNPNAVGDRGASVGLFQIHARGMAPLFYQWGYSDRADPWEASDFAARAFSAGYGWRWSCS